MPQVYWVVIRSLMMAGSATVAISFIVGLVHICLWRPTNPHFLTFLAFSLVVGIVMMIGGMLAGMYATRK